MLSRRIVNKSAKKRPLFIPTGIPSFSEDQVNDYLLEKGFTRGSLILYDYSNDGEHDDSYRYPPLSFALVLEVCSDPNKLQNHYGDSFPRVYKVVDIYTSNAHPSSIYSNPPRWVTGEYHRLFSAQEEQLLDDYIQNRIKEILETC